MSNTLQIKKKLDKISTLSNDIKKIISQDYHKKTKTKKEIKEPLLLPENKRYTIFPIKHKVLWSMYKILVAGHWVPEEVSLEQDISDWKKLDKDTKYFISNILAFFAISDEIVSLNIMENFASEIGPLEAKKCYNFICHQEDIHSEVYGLMIEAYIQNPKQKKKLLNAVEHIPCIAKKVNWAKKWIYSDESFAKRVLAFIIVESIFFSGSFCAIFWVTRNGDLKGLKLNNGFISGEEGSHCVFGIILYFLLYFKIDEKIVHQMFKDAVKIEEEFITISLPCDLIGMNKKLMIQYIRYVADRTLVQLSYKKIYNVSNPFSFMQKIGLENKTNFFEDRVSEYQKLPTNKYHKIIAKFFQSFVSAKKYWKDIENLKEQLFVKKIEKEKDDSSDSDNNELKIDDDF